MLLKVLKSQELGQTQFDNLIKVIEKEKAPGRAVPQSDLESQYVSASSYSDKSIP